MLAPVRMFSNAKMGATDVCRLCLSTEDLIWIFNEENTKINMRDVIFLTTGIEIYTSDLVSQKVCEKCYEFSIKAFQFRSSCLMADKYLKSLCEDDLADKKMLIPNTEVTIKRVTKYEESNPKFIFTKPTSQKMHPSVIELLRIYPKLKIPKACLPLNVTPMVDMELNKVENHFKKLKLNFKKCVKDTLRTNMSLKTESESKTSALGCRSVENKDKELDTDKEEGIGTDLQTGKKRKSATEERSSEMTNCFTKEKRARISSVCHCMLNSATNITTSTRRKSILDGISSDKTREVESSTLEKGKDKTDKQIEAIANLYDPRNENIVETSPLIETVHAEEENDEDMLMKVEKSVTLFICDICNSVQYSRNDLKKHKNKHMRCQFCKIKFRSLKSTNFHVENVCKMKKMMNDLPQVVIKKIEYDEDIGKKYASAFEGFPSLLLSTNCHRDNIVKESYLKICPTDKLNVIEILSDNDTVLPVSSVVEKEQSPIIPQVFLENSRFSKLVDLTGLTGNHKKDLKYMLTVLQSDRDCQPQTLPPKNEDIVTGEVTVLKLLKHHLQYYKIPVKIQPGEFQVTYDYDSTKEAKKMCLWDDLTPTDIKLN